MKLPWPDVDIDPSEITLLRVEDDATVHIELTRPSGERLIVDTWWSPEVDRLIVAMQGPQDEP